MNVADWIPRHDEVAVQIDRPLVRAQTLTSNRPEAPFVPLVGESAVRLAHVGLSPLRIEGVPAALHVEGGKLVRARRDRVGRLGEFRALVVEDHADGLVSVAFVPRPSLDLGIFCSEIVSTTEGVRASLGIYVGTGSWFAGQHAHRAWQELRRAAPDLVEDGGPRSARDRQRGFAVELHVDRDLLHRVEELHRRAWCAYARSLADVLELDVEGAERNARALEAWRAHRRSGSLVSQALRASGSADIARIHAEVLAA